MPSRTAVCALFAEIFARHGERHDGSDTEAFTLSPDGHAEVAVHYDSDEQVIWLTSFFPPVTDEAIVGVLQRLLLKNLLSVANGFACAMDAESGAPVLQSWLNRSFIYMTDFDAALERHLGAACEIRLLLAEPAEAPQHSSPVDSIRVWG